MRRRHPGKVERGRTEAPNVADVPEDLGDYPALGLPLGGDVPEAGSDERAREIASVGDREPPVAQAGTAAARRAEELVAQRVENDAGERSGCVGAADRDRPMRD